VKPGAKSPAEIPTAAFSADEGGMVSLFTKERVVGRPSKGKKDWGFLVKGAD